MFVRSCSNGWEFFTGLGKGSCFLVLLVETWLNFDKYSTATCKRETIAPRVTKFFSVGKIRNLKQVTRQGIGTEAYGEKTFLSSKLVSSKIRCQWLEPKEQPSITVEDEW